MIQNLSVCLRVFKNVCNFEDNASVSQYHFEGNVIDVQTTNKIIEEGRDGN